MRGVSENGATGGYMCTTASKEKLERKYPDKNVSRKRSRLIHDSV